MRLILLLCLFTSLACKDGVEDSGCDNTWLADIDGDGFGDDATLVFGCEAPEGHVATGGDCDDSDANTFPGAEEVCDGDDEDCDGQVDEAGLSTLYVDADADGFGDEATAFEGCLDEGGVLEAGDCDDSDPAVFPGAEELCNEVDDDCDGDVDGGATDASDWHVDADGDGFGDPEATVRACALPEGASAEAGDCDDERAAVYPGAAEVCNDGVVNDCDGDEASARAACALAAEVNLADADAILLGEARDDLAGGALAGGGDLDGDGLDDVVIGARGHASRALNAGAAYLVLSPRGDVDLVDAAARLLGERADDRFGSAVALVGDALGEGLPAVAVGAPGADDGAAEGGAAFLFSGATRGSVDAGQAATIWTGSEASGALGQSLAGGWDVDGDGALDLALGAPSAGNGVVYLVNAAGAGGSVAGLEWMTGTAPGDELGAAVAMGDLDGDGRGDVAAGAPAADPNGSRSGEVLLRYGDDDDGRASRLKGASNADAAGTSLAVGDADGDGYDDLLVGVPFRGNADDGAAWLFTGAGSQRGDVANMANSADLVLAGGRRGDEAGGAVAIIDDLDGDGDGELLVGGAGAEGGLGAAWLVTGGQTGTVDLGSAASTMIGRVEGDETGGAAARAGDVDGDGAGDLWLGARGNDDGGEEAGCAYLILGPGI